MPAWLPADPNKRRAVAAALLLLSIMVIAAAVCVPAVLLHRHYDENIARLVRQVGTQTAFNALRPRLAEKLDSLKSRDVKKLFLKGTSSALALAELQEAVRTAIEANGGRVVSSVQGNAPKEEGAYRQVAATFNMNTNNANLRRVLYTLESREPYLFIDSVVIQPQGYRPAPGAPEPDMFVQLDVRAFALRTASEMAPPSPPQTAPGSSPTSKDKAAAT
jgi:general secretion pathway protein M